jgi:predicted aspartyl protease
LFKFDDEQIDEALVIHEMGILHIDIEIAAVHSARERRVLRVMVDTGSEYNWVPAETLHELGVDPVRVDRFETADGRILERQIGFALLFAAGRSAAGIVVFAQPGDMVLLGAHGLEGMNLRVDLVRRELVPAGPVPAAAA